MRRFLVGEESLEIVWGWEGGSWCEGEIVRKEMKIKMRSWKDGEIK